MIKEILISLQGKIGDCICWGWADWSGTVAVSERIKLFKAANDSRITPEISLDAARLAMSSSRIVSTTDCGRRRIAPLRFSFFFVRFCVLFTSFRIFVRFCVGWLVTSFRIRFTLDYSTLTFGRSWVFVTHFIDNWTFIWSNTFVGFWILNNDGFNLFTRIDGTYMESYLFASAFHVCKYSQVLNAIKERLETSTWILFRVLWYDFELLVAISGS